MLASNVMTHPYRRRVATLEPWTFEITRTPSAAQPGPSLIPCWAAISAISAASSRPTQEKSAAYYISAVAVPTCEADVRSDTCARQSVPVAPCRLLCFSKPLKDEREYLTEFDCCGVMLGSDREKRRLAPRQLRARHTALLRLPMKKGAGWAHATACLLFIFIEIFPGGE